MRLELVIFVSGVFYVVSDWRRDGVRSRQMRFFDWIYFRERASRRVKGVLEVPDFVRAEIDFDHIKPGGHIRQTRFY